MLNILLTQDLRASEWLTKHADNFEKEKQMYGDNKIALCFAGVAEAAQDKGLNFLMIKGVSYYADGTNYGTDDWRRFASVMAASCTAHFIKNYVTELEGSLEEEKVY